MRKDNDKRIYLNDWDTTTVYLKNVIDDPDIEVGDHTYYNDPDHDPRDFVKNNVRYHFPEFMHDKIVIGKYCSLACGTTFLAPLCMHKLDSLSTYPFPIIPEHWDYPFVPEDTCTLKGPTIVGNDVWFGFKSLVMPGVHIGDGAIIGTRSVVTKDVEPYTIVGGAPARVIRKRFDDDTITRLQALKWWDLPDDLVRILIPDIIKGDIDAVEQKKWIYDVVKATVAAIGQINKPS